MVLVDAGCFVVVDVSGGGGGRDGTPAVAGGGTIHHVEGNFHFDLSDLQSSSSLCAITTNCWSDFTSRRLRTRSSKEPQFKRCSPMSEMLAMGCSRNPGGLTLPDALDGIFWAPVGFFLLIFFWMWSDEPTAQLLNASKCFRMLPDAMGTNRTFNSDSSKLIFGIGFFADSAGFFAVSVVSADPGRWSWRRPLLQHRIETNRNKLQMKRTN